MDIRVNGKKVSVMSVELIPGYYKVFDFEVNGKRVYGWAGAMKEAGKNWKFGFDLINHGRIIKANDLLSRQAHTSLARLVGEVHLDDFPTDIHKTDFMRQKEDFQIMQDILLNDILADLISKVGKLTNREVLDKYSVDILNMTKTLNKIIQNQQFLNQFDLAEYLFKNSGTPRVASPKEEVVDEEKITLVSDERKENENKEDKKDNKDSDSKKDKPSKTPFIIEEPVVVSLGEDSPLKRWQIFHKENGIYLNIQINLDHPVYSNEEEVGVLIKNIVFDCLSEFLLQEEKKQLGFMDDEIERLNQIKDMIIRYSMKAS